MRLTGGMGQLQEKRIRHWGLGLVVIQRICNVYNRSKPSRTINQLKKEKKMYRNVVADPKKYTESLGGNAAVWSSRFQQGTSSEQRQEFPLVFSPNTNTTSRPSVNWQMPFWPCHKAGQA